MQGSTPQSEDGTVLPFPDRFHAASEFVLNPPTGILFFMQAIRRDFKSQVQGSKDECTDELLSQLQTLFAVQEVALSPGAGAAPFDDETKLILYALNQQAVHGECKEPKPWAWSAVESAKWNSWMQLKDMPKVEAMRLFVKVLEESVQVVINETQEGIRDPIYPSCEPHHSSAQAPLLADICDLCLAPRSAHTQDCLAEASSIFSPLW